MQESLSELAKLYEADSDLVKARFALKYKRFEFLRQLRKYFPIGSETSKGTVVYHGLDGHDRLIAVKDKQGCIALYDFNILVQTS